MNDDYTEGHSLTLKEKIYQNFIEDARWQYIVKGFANTMLITFFACLIGMFLGFLFAIIRVAHDKNGSLKILNLITKAYLVMMRGTPVMVQLLIIYYVIFSTVNVSKILVVIIAFGLNSAAYVAEVVRSGIMSIDNGQMDLTRGGDIIRSNTYEAFLPLLAVALVYLVVVMLLTTGVNRLERSLKKMSDKLFQKRKNSCNRASLLDRGVFCMLR